MQSIIKIVLKKKITIKYNNENIKKFDVSHILYCDKIFSGYKNSLKLYCGYFYKNDNKIDQNDEYMYNRFFKGDNGCEPDIYINVLDYDFTIETSFLDRRSE